MSSNLPLRAIRIPILQRQCLFQQRRRLQPLRLFSTTAPQLFTSTPSRGKASARQQDRAMTRENIKHQIRPAPSMALQEAQSEGGFDMLAEDIGLLQDTIVRASLSKVPGIWTPQFWGYHWKLLKSKGTALYSRSSYNQCMVKEGIWRFLPVDTMEDRRLRELAKAYYSILYSAFAERNTSNITRFCLPPLARNFQNRIAARGSLEMKWELLKMHSASVVSHRASLVGEDHPDSAYRQAVVRLVSTQRVQWSKGLRTHLAVRPQGRLQWMPEEAKGAKEGSIGREKNDDYADNGVPKKVIEYIVLQKRVLGGNEDEKWKVWGFTQEHTPELVAGNEAYWRKVMDTHAVEA